MKKLNLLLLVFLLPALIFWTACEEDTGNSEDSSDSTEVIELGHTQLLLDKIVENGDIINSKRVPTMISSADVYSNLENNFLILDIRKAKDYAAGHIKGSVNLKLIDLVDYFDGNDTGEFEKVVLVCYSGQSASYAASALQMLAYDNVYVMKWGMCSWNDKFAGKWLVNKSNKYADQLEIVANEKAPAGELPEFECTHTDGKEILLARVNKIFNDGFHKRLVTADDVFTNPNDYYIVNYWSENAYLIGHIPGAVCYEPKSSLNIAADLLSLPTDKKIVVYCYTGQHSAFVTAYLRILGYDAYSLKFGSNSFMNTIMKDNRDLGHAFTEDAINEFEFETGVYEAEEEGGR